MEYVSRICLLMEFTPVELVKVAWQFGFGHSIYCLQLQLATFVEILVAKYIFTHCGDQNGRSSKHYHVPWGVRTPLLM